MLVTSGLGSSRSPCTTDIAWPITA